MSQKRDLFLNLLLKVSSELYILIVRVAFLNAWYLIHFKSQFPSRKYSGVLYLATLALGCIGQRFHTSLTTFINLPFAITFNLTAGIRFS